jgi:ubiquinone/menaquinone biosynthesis C-methylase UbiE
VNHETIYRQRPEAYDRLVSREDHQGNLASALEPLLPPEGGRIVDLGTGTGRVARLLSTDNKRLVACDRSLPMLRVAAQRDVPSDAMAIEWVAADNRNLPLATGCAALVVAGWSLGHSVGWYPGAWRFEIGRALAEMLRVTARGGTQAVIETLGTGSETPLAPNQGLADFYRWLEEEHGFVRQWMRTDYLFESPEEAEQLVRFFFGDEMGERVRSGGVQLVPECTGLWTRRIEALA